VQGINSTELNVKIKVIKKWIKLSHVVKWMKLINNMKEKEYGIPHIILVV